MLKSAPDKSKSDGWKAAPQRAEKASEEIKQRSRTYVDKWVAVNGYDVLGRRGKLSDFYSLKRNYAHEHLIEPLIHHPEIYNTSPNPAHNIKTNSMLSKGMGCDIKYEMLMYVQEKHHGVVMGSAYSDDDDDEEEDEHEPIELKQIQVTFSTSCVAGELPDGDDTLIPEIPIPEIFIPEIPIAEIFIPVIPIPEIHISTQTSPPETVSFKRPSKMSDYFKIIKDVQHMLDMDFCEAEVGEEKIKEAVLVAREVQVRMGEFLHEFGQEEEIEQGQDEVC